MFRRIPLALILVGCNSGSDANPSSTPASEATAVFDIQPIVVDTGWPDVGDTDTDTDTDADTDTDTDADTDTDVVDTDTDVVDTDVVDTDVVDTDTDVPPACTVVFSAEIRDASGTVGTSWSVDTDDLSAFGVVSNPCTETVTFQTTTSCLVDSYAVTDLDGGSGESVSNTCVAVITDWSIEPGEKVEESTNLGTYDAPANIRVDVAFGDGADTVESVTFTVN